MNQCLHRMRGRGCRGAGLIEVVVGVAIIVAAIIGLVTAYGYFIRSADAHGMRVKATFLLEEGIEVVRILRDTDWDTFIALEDDTSYWLAWSVSGWEATTTPTYIDGIFERTIEFGPVYRDANDDIAQSGTLDSGTRHVVVTVQWPTRVGSTTVDVETYVTDIFFSP